MSALTSRRNWLQAAVTTALGWSGAAWTAPALVQLTPARALAHEVDQAVRQGEPLLVMVSLEGCAFCRAVRQSYLGPLQQAGQPMVQVDMRSAMRVHDFEGQSQTHDQMVKRWKVSIAPTVLFIGRGGREVAERLEGAYLPDFYGAYLDDRLSKARKAIST